MSFDFGTLNTAVAYWGAFTGTATFIWRIYELFQRHRPCINVKAYVGVIYPSDHWKVVYPPDVYPPRWKEDQLELAFGPGEPCLIIEATNVRRRPATITCAYLGTPGKTQYPYVPHVDELPRQLDEGENFFIKVPLSSLKFRLPSLQQSIVKDNAFDSIKFAWIRDSTGKVWKTRISRDVKRELLAKARTK